MANNPDFVRLADRMVNGLVVDMETSWSISGYDVQEFPDDREQARFVRRKLNEGTLEPASQAEFDEAHPEEEDEDPEAAKFLEAIRAATGRSGLQEHRVQKQQQAAHTALLATRFKAKLDEEGLDADEYDADSYAYAADKARREAAVEEAKELGLGEDDAEGQKERTATRGARRAPAKKAGSRRRASSEGEETPTE